VIFFGRSKGGKTTMVEINIEVAPHEPDKLRELLEHVVKEITDAEYRESTASDTAFKVDSEWVYTEQGKYNWRKQG
jgi:hypothetical protein